MTLLQSIILWLAVSLIIGIILIPILVHERNRKEKLYKDISDSINNNKKGF